MAVDPHQLTAHLAYGDILARVDLDSYRRIPWEKETAFFLVDFWSPTTKTPLPICPRNLLKRIVGEFHALGLEPMCGAEFEFFQFDETPASLREKHFQQLTPLTPGMFGYSLLRPTLKQDYYYDLINQCRAFDVPLEAIHTETGPGVYEVALAYAPALAMADRAQLFKTSAKQIGLLHGVMPSFMAKPYNDLPGCSGHLHFSLRDRTDSTNAFADTKAQPSSGDASTAGMSQTMQHFLAGMLKGLPSILAILAPTVNSYKRLVGSYWAPCAVNWGRENRLAAVRAITTPTCSAASTRLEMRVPGADINAHLAIAACLACGLYGIREKLELPPPASEDGSATSGAIDSLARNLYEATEVMAAPDSMARKVLGDAFVEHYVATRRHEWTKWAGAVTDWELRRYLELV
ncbi:hypothetical protein SYNPS1DRAFT_17217 [Syncephalis pseudoplumigaleata]|uniref:GS catalytic domain-containing protein n=1 Tax=Syncephalis pseudoplumigaleata TaxID=1712513 RepID=A0A4P9YZI3_9FUNG|nr:hypothetical protein SYNPS1DRAFT_17217 [Syncephalis pseudoplumigaleata]|eukprot:RKP24450.1 hypothetical protein SYNPS1DRAFT_17217 [Syncephalis pseudoplumigaleata]